MTESRSLKILLYSLNYAPELTGVGKYSGEMAEWLAAQGHDVRVVCAPPYYPHWCISTGYSRWWYAREDRAGVAVWRCPLWVPHRPGGLTRLMHLFSFVLTSTPVLLCQVFWRPDVVVAMEPSFIGAPSVLLTARLAKCHAWLHVQDLEVDAAFSLGLFRSGRMSRFAFWLERRIKSAFDRVSTISDAMAARLRDKLKSLTEVLVFPNWVDTESIRPLTRMSVLRAELGIGTDIVVALYAGNMGNKQGLELILDAACRLAFEPELLFVMCGDGVAAKRLRRESSKMDNMRWLPLQPIERLNELLNLADIHLLPQRADAADLVMPSKLTGMMASGRAVVATVSPDTEVARAVGEGGRITSPGDGPAFAEALMELVTDRGLRDRMGRAARLYAEQHWQRDAVLGHFEKALLQQVGTDAASGEG